MTLQGVRGKGVVSLEFIRKRDEFESKEFWKISTNAYDSSNKDKH